MREQTVCISVHNGINYLPLAVKSVRENSYDKDCPFVIYSENEIQAYKIVNLLGKVVLESYAVTSNEINVNSRNFSSGLYIVEVVTTQNRTKEFIVIK